MKISKTKDTFDDYKIEQISFRQIQVMLDNLSDAVGADADELRANLEWSLERLPKPGQSEEDLEPKDGEAAPDKKPGGKTEDLESPVPAPSPAPEPGSTPAPAADDIGGAEDDLDIPGLSLGLPDLPEPTA